MNARLSAIGNAIVDIQAEAQDDFLAGHGLDKGSMALVNKAQSARLYDGMGATSETSGGSAANTSAGVAALGTSAIFIGATGSDQFGSIFAHDMKAQGVEFHNAQGGGPTAHCLILISPDGQRTMRTHLGVASQIPASHLDAVDIRGTDLLLVEGYLWSDPTSRATVREALSRARTSDSTIAFGASSVSCIDAHREDFLQLMKDGAIDILFANEEEVCALSSMESFGEGAHFLASMVTVLVATQGANGSTAYVNGNPVSMPAHPVDRVVDTTGAGDMFCAGFLHGWMSDRDASKALRIASIVAAEAISHHGARARSDLQSMVAAELQER